MRVLDLLAESKTIDARTIVPVLQPHQHARQCHADETSVVGVLEAPPAHVFGLAHYRLEVHRLPQFAKAVDTEKGRCAPYDERAEGGCGDAGNALHGRDV